MALAAAAAMARKGTSRKTKISGLLKLGEALPFRPDADESRCLTVVPKQCPKKCGPVTIRQPLCRGCGEPTGGLVKCPACGTRENFDRRVYCISCGWDSFLVRP